jgi:hypothetical protein
MRFLLFFLLFFPIAVLSQIVTGKIVNEDNEPVPYTNITLLRNKIGSCTNLDGTFKLDIAGEKLDSIKFTSIGYEALTLPLANIGKGNNLGILTLKKSNLFIDEVLVLSSKIDYSKKHKLGLDKVDNVSFYTLYGDEICTFIPNVKHRKGKLAAVNLYLSRRDKADYTADLNVKLYFLDTVRYKPGKLLYAKNIIVSPGNKKQVLSINLDDKNIYIPNEGVCIGIEWIGHDKGSGTYTLGPGLKYTNASRKMLTWNNYRGRGWINGTFKYDGNVSNALVTIDVLYEK